MFSIDINLLYFLFTRSYLCMFTNIATISIPNIQFIT
uniref:Uncharacterized protein n=1 Tax=Siphoviridae sp. cteLh2 TaxID=2825590 RepID=A0A8S5U5X4_9CAUD|nr:MAG TPA: hypothetical protein [Siphoviridae sp. cteLh2]